MGGHREGLQRPCGDQPETSVRRGKPQASDSLPLQAIDPAPTKRSFVFLPVLNLEVPDFLRGDGLDEEIGNLEVGPLFFVDFIRAYLFSSEIFPYFLNSSLRASLVMT